MNCDRAPCERADQLGHALEAEEAADEEQHRRVVIDPEQPIEVRVGVAHRSRRTGLGPTLGIVDQKPPERFATRARDARARVEALDVHAVGQRGDVLGRDPEHRDRLLPVQLRHGDEVIGELRLPFQVIGPELAVPPVLPPGGAQQLSRCVVEVVGSVGVRDPGRGVGHRCQRLAE